jgi:hypothetical protein
LRRERSVIEGITHSGPRLQRRRRQKPAFANRLLGIRHAAPDADTALGGAAKVSQPRMRDGRMSEKDCHG